MPESVLQMNIHHILQSLRKRKTNEKMVFDNDHPVNSHYNNVKWILFLANISRQLKYYFFLICFVLM